MKASKIFILLGIISITIQTIAQPKYDYPPFLTFMPKITKLEKVTPETIDQKKQEILTIKKQLSAKVASNPELQKLLKEKKALKETIKNINQSIHSVYFIPKNQAVFQAYQKAKLAKNISTQLQSALDSIMQEITNNQKQLTQNHAKLFELKAKIKKADPSRNNLIKKLHNANQELDQMKFTQIKSIPDRSK